MTPSSHSLPLSLLLILCTILLPRSGGSLSGNHDTLMLGKFHRWMSLHNRSYTSADEKLRRFEVYRHNVEYIQAMNINGGLGYELRENEFTDLTPQEFSARYIGGISPKTNDSNLAGDPIITTLVGAVREGHQPMEGKDSLRPRNFDWREKGAVSPAKQQGDCGSCWAFAAIAVLEAQIQIKTGDVVDLSEQELVDCSTTDPQVCKYGWLTDEALRWIQKQGGVVTESMYPYEAKQGYCRTKDGASLMGKIIDTGKVKAYEKALMDAVLRAPVAAAMALLENDPNLQHLGKGIFKGPCDYRPTHAVVLVGFGETTAGEKYWIVKNSWGSSWGDEGFFRVRRGYEGDGWYGLCLINKDAFYALI